MKKRTMALVISCVLSVSAVGAVSVYAADNTEQTAEQTTDQAAEQTADTEEKKEFGTIGEKQSDTDYQVELKNATGKDIKTISVSIDSEEFTELKLSGEEPFKADETRILFCTPKTKNADGTDVKNPPVYDLQITFTDAKAPELTLHTLPFGDTDSMEIRFEEPVAYLVFTSKSLKKEIDTLTSEKVKNGVMTAEEAYGTSESSYYGGDDEDYDDYDDYEDYDDGGNDGGDACLDDAVLF